MIRSVTFEETLYAEPPARFEAGTPNIAGAIGLGAALDYLRSLGLAAMEAYEKDLTDYAVQRLREIEGVRLIGEPSQRAGVVSFVLEDVHPHDIGTVLDREGVAIRTGHHCAQPVMEFFGIPATARASFAFYNTRAEVDALVAGLHRTLELFHKMSELRDLYQEVILDHYRHPRNHGRLDEASHEADGYNPLCGDRIHLTLRMDGERIAAIAFEGAGCAISTASASLLTESIEGKNRAEAERLFARFHKLVTEENPEVDADESLGKLAVFAGVREYPVRVKCATLAWHTLKAALEEEQSSVTTE